MKDEDVDSAMSDSTIKNEIVTSYAYELRNEFPFSLFCVKIDCRIRMCYEI